MGESLKELFKEISGEMAKAIESAGKKQSDIKKSEGDENPSGLSDEVKAVLQPIVKALDMDVKDGAAPLVKKILELAEASETYADVLEKMIERVEHLEKGTAVSKSVKGQDDDDDHRKVKKNDSDDDEGVWDNVVKALVKTGSVTLN